MNKYKFNIIEKFVVWKTLEGKCFWCGVLLELTNTTIDHFLPECLLDNEEEFNIVKRNYGLSDDFEINNFCNWVPCCNHCNSTKSGKINNAPILILALHRIIEKSKNAKKEYAKLQKKRKRDQVLGVIAGYLESQSISESDLAHLINCSYFIPEIDLGEKAHVPDGSRIISINRDLGTISVIYNGRVGRSPIDLDPDISWECPICHNYGPWNGNQCLRCGYFHDPLD
jgi:hypothetical protein